MNWSYLFTFLIGIGVYCVIMLCIAFYKRHKNKKRLEQKKAKENEETKDK